MKAFQAKKIMFLCFGSIHAERKIKIFLDDPRFEVTVVSNHDYNFPNATNIRLSKKLLQMSSDSFVIKKDLLYPVRLCFLFLQIITALIQEAIITICDAYTIKKAIRKYRPDLLYFQTLLYPSFLALFLNIDIPFIVTFLNGDLTWFSKNTGIERLLKKYIIKMGVHKAGLITVNGFAAQMECQKYTINPEKIKIVFDSGIDLDLFKPIDKKIAKDKIGIKNSHIILCPRGIGRFYNSFSIIKAAQTILNDLPDTIFIIFMDSSSKYVWKEHQKLMTELTLPLDHFIALDKSIASSEMPYYYNASDIMISLSSNDSKPNTMLEAFACGIPLIMGDLPQIRETITNGLNGFLVDPANISELAEKIRILLLNSDIRKRFIEFNLALVKEEFDAKKVSDKMKNLILSHF